MSQELQEIRQVMTWDTTDAESGATRMERAFERIEKAEKHQVEQSRKTQADAKPPGGGRAGGGHGSDSNLVAGIRDFAEGRGMNALTRFTQTAKLAGPAVTAVFTAYKIGRASFDYYKQGVEATDKAGERLRETLHGVSKAATFATVGEGAAKIAGTFDGLDEQLKGERKQQGDIADSQRVRDSNVVSKALFGGWEWFRSTGIGGGHQTSEEKMAESQLRERLAAREQAQMRTLYTGALTADRDSARDRLVGDTFGAQRKENQRKEATEEADARSHGLGTDANLKLIREKYAAEQEGIDKAERAADRQLETEGRLLDIRRRGGAVEAETARARLAAAEDALRDEVVGTRGYREKSQARDAAAAEVVATDRAEATRRADFRVDSSVAGFTGNASSRSSMQAQAEVDKAREHLRILQTTVGMRATEKELNEANLRLVSAQTAQALLQRQQYMQRADTRLDQGVADFAGNEDQRAALAAGAEVEKAREHLALVRSVKGANENDLEVMQAKLEVSRALLSQELQRRQQIAAQRDLASAIRLAPGGVAAAGARLNGSSPEAAERAALSAHVDAAQEAYDNARKRAVEEKNSVASLQAQTAAAKELAGAQVALALHEQQLRRERALTMESVRGQTASLRFAASGRDDLADIEGQRAQTSVAIKRANLAGHPEEAAELAEQQRLRERKMTHDMYLNPDGTRRNPFDVQREMHERIVKQTRIAQYDKALDRNGGLMSVGRDMNGRITSGVDPLTGQHLNAREIAARNAAAQATVDGNKEKMGDHEVFTNILKTLTDRLPEASK